MSVHHDRPGCKLDEERVDLTVERQTLLKTLSELEIDH
jgi:hypothetical protein